MTTKMSMSETVAKHNELAALLGVEPVTNFKSLNAARAALETLENRMNTQVDTPEVTPETEANPLGDGATEAAPATSADPKYNSSGKRGPTQGVGAFCKGLIVEGKTNAEILAAVATTYPTAKTTANCVAYYRAKLAKAGKETPADPAAALAAAKEMLAKAQAAEAAAQAALDAQAAEPAQATEPAPEQQAA